MQTSSTGRERTKGLSIGAALLAALAASSCCLGPVLLAALGLGGAGLFAGIAAYRPLMLAVTAVFLSVGFYLSYRRPKVVQADACGCDAPKARNLPRRFLWGATVITVLVAAAPPLLAKLSTQRSHSPSPTSAAATAVIKVEGIDCEACAAPIRKALVAAGGFDDLTLDVPSKMLSVSYEPAPGRPAVYVKAIDDLGYEATLTAAQDAKEVAR
jgi:mercuric ion transport protein